MRLYLVQHGEAAPKQDDPERPLTPQGRADVTALAEFLGARGVAAARVIHSGKLRAAQTAEILAVALAPGATPEAENGLDPKDPVGPFAKRLADWQEDSLVVGHLPFMARCVAHLAVGDADADVVGYRPGTLVALEREEGGDWRIVWMIGPEFTVPPADPSP